MLIAFYHASHTIGVDIGLMPMLEPRVVNSFRLEVELSELALAS